MEQYNETIAATLENVAHANKIITNNMASQMAEAMNTYCDQIYQNNDLSKILSEILLKFLVDSQKI